MIQTHAETKMRGAGDRLPQVVFKLRRDGSWVERTSADLFGGRRVVIFAVPGAFASACSGRHLPGYIALSGNIRRMGIDEIFCVSVNDAFVMNAWARDQGIDGEVTLLPDGNADFTRAMGMLADWSSVGFGPRSWRYSMVAADGLIERIFVEDPRHGIDPFAVSDAITLLDQLDRDSRRLAGE
ncbi:MAG: peroxiredoxin [Kiloniellaceae bacterium]